jgi:hypothetical protein
MKCFKIVRYHQNWCRRQTGYPTTCSKNNGNIHFATEKGNKSPGATEYNGNDNFAVEITNSVHSAPDTDSNPPGLTENNNTSLIRIHDVRLQTLIRLITLILPPPHPRPSSPRPLHPFIFVSRLINRLV